jgi:hypothetical protein
MSETEPDSSSGKPFHPASPSRLNSHRDMDSVAQETSGLGMAVFRLPVGAAEISLRRSAVAWLLAAVLLAMAGAAVACFFPAKIDAAVLKQLRKPLTLWARGNIRPEPVEREIYLVLTLLSPAAALIGGWWVGLFRIRRIGLGSVNSQRGRLDLISSAAGVGLALMAVAVMLTLEFPSLAEVFRPLSSPWKLPCAVAGSLVLVTMASSVSVVWRAIWLRRKLTSRLRWIALAAVCGLILARVAAMGIFDVYHTRRLGPMDWNTVFYGVSQAAAGARPMVDFTAQYGYYSALLKPWFALIGLSVFSFTATMAALQGLSMACIGWILWLFGDFRGISILIGGHPVSFKAHRHLVRRDFEGDISLRWPRRPHIERAPRKPLH